MHNINTVCERVTLDSMDDLPNFSIALDGYVKGPVIDLQNHKFSFGHHYGVIRHITSATCVQVADALLLGFNPNGYSVYINDIDGDTVLSTFLLLNGLKEKDTSLRWLVEGIGKVDAHGPGYILTYYQSKTVDYFYDCVLEPLNKIKKERKYGTCDLKELLDACLENLESWANNEFKITDKKEEYRFYEVYWNNVVKDFVMASSNDYCVDILYKEGYNKFVAFQQQKDGSFAYSIGKKSEFVDFNVKGILSELNEIENGWGGGSTIGGAPRNKDGSRSNLLPGHVLDIVKKYLYFRNG